MSRHDQNQLVRIPKSQRSQGGKRAIVVYKYTCNICDRILRVEVATSVLPTMSERSGDEEHRAALAANQEYWYVDGTDVYCSRHAPLGLGEY